MNTDTSHSSYFSQMLSQSGDIHPNPGPIKPKVARKSKRHKSNLLKILAMLIILINQINELKIGRKETPKHIINLRLHFKHASTQILMNKLWKFNKKKMKLNKTSSHNYYIFLLILLSGDIEVNPGPDNICNVCKQTSSSSKLIQCENCLNFYHLSCKNNNNLNQLSKTKDFSWVCPNRNCKLNYETQKIDPFTTATINKFSNLESITMNKNTKNRKSKQNHKPKLKHKNYKKHRISLWDELTKITPDQYAGHDICFKCNKKVFKPTTVNCIKCNRKAHMKCISKQSKTQESCSKITCKLCSKDDEEVKAKVNIKTINLDIRPKSMDKIRTGKNELLIIHLNSRSLINKMEDVLIIIQTVKPDILCVTETWLNGSVPLNALTPSGYKQYRQDRTDRFKETYGRNKGGGILVFYKEEIEIEKRILFKNDFEENIWLLVKLPKQSFLLGTIYRAEYTNLLQEIEEETLLERYLQQAHKICNNVIVLGDLNADVKLESECPKGKKVHDIFTTYGMNQIIEKPTRIDPKTGKATLIDHIWLDKQKIITQQSGTMEGISDHFAVYLTMSTQIPKKPEKIISIRNYKNYNQQKFCEELNESLKQSNLETLINQNEVNKAMEVFIEIIQQATENNAPMKEIKIKEHQCKVPWFTEELRNKIILKNKTLRDWHLYKLEEDKKELKKLKNEVNHLKAKLKRAYYTKEIEKTEGDSKKAWKVLKTALGKIQNKECIEPSNLSKEKANEYNKFFASIGIEIQNQLKTQNHETNFENLQGFNFKEETEEKVMKLITKLKPDVAVGYDNLNAKLIKDAKDILTPWLTKIINISYKTCTFPDNMKITNIKPIFKENNKEKISNYRPISILPVISKIFERACTDQLVKHLEENDLISRTQHAYRKGHSTQTCLVEIVNKLYENIDKGHLTAIAKLDLSKAFDSISHTLLLHKLSKLGLSEDSINYLKSYLTNRKQRTKFKNYTSDEETIKSGIPQGSILGPILFVCFTNDLAEEFKNECKVVCYADDTQLIVQAKNMEQLKYKIENVIKTAQNWYSRNSMKNNIGKTEILVIQRNNKLQKVVIEIEDDGKPVRLIPQKEIKTLGIYIDSNLNWDKQVKYTKKLAMNAILNLNRLRNILPEHIKILLYNSIVTPHFNYADVVWNGCSTENENKLQTAQNFALRIIKNRSKKESAKEIRNELKFLNLKQKREVHEAVFIKKALLNKLSQNITYEYLEHLPSEKTRQADEGKLNIPEHRTSFYKKSPIYRTIKIWNNIPKTINEYNDPSKFKQKYQHYLIETRTH